MYQVAGPTPDNLFFGRERELQEICDHVASVNYLLVGGRRIGKSSILKRLQRVRLPAAGYNALYHDCSFTVSETELVEAVINDRSWFSSVPPSPPSSFAALVDMLQSTRPLVVLLDETDSLIAPDRATGYRLFNAFRALSQSGRCRFVLCGEQSLRAELMNTDSPLYNFATPMRVGRLEYRAVEELVTRPMRQLEVELTDKEAMVQRIWSFTSGHPNIVQRLCRRLILRLSTRRGRQLRNDDIEDVVEDPDFQRNDFLHVYWERATALERLCSLVMAFKGEEQTLSGVHEALLQHGVKCNLLEVDGALERLVDLRNILNRTPAGYTFAATAFPKVIAGTTRQNDLIALNREFFARHGDVDPHTRRGEI